MTKKAEKMATIIGVGAAVGAVGMAAAAATVGAGRKAPRKRLAKDARQVGHGVTTMWNDVLSMMH